jgi:ATP phosphoribosyltransferase
MAAEGKVVLMMNVLRAKLADVLAILPALKNPTVSDLANREWVDVVTILDETVVRHLIPRLKAAGACGIVEYPLSKVID